MTGTHVVWFKRDLRLVDHRALAEAVVAAERDRVALIPLYIVEPGLWSGTDMGARQWDFVRECLGELDRALAQRGSRLVVYQGACLEVLSALHRRYPIGSIWSHEETGNRFTHERDRAVRRWTREQGIGLREVAQHGVIRRLGSRSGWARRWDRFMAEPLTDVPARVPAPPGDLEADRPPAAGALGHDEPCPGRQHGGRRAGRALLESFLQERGVDYRRAMSTPVAGWEACSRLSPHLAHGTLSMREVAQAAWQRVEALRSQPRRDRDNKSLAQSIDSFIARLHWRDHFTQKLEDAPELEFEDLHPGYAGLRDDDPDHPHLVAWSEGRTGLPFVDACMRCLAHTGWMNFRMRAMLQATATYHLWRHWRSPSLVLARRFTDYEPGIHYPQSQMQAGVTGINAVRIYNPVKQGHDQDPDGAFVARWVPELAGLPGPLRQEPWKARAVDLESAGIRLGHDYPERVIDHEQAAREARQAMHARRQDPEFRAIADAIQARHGSRRSGLRRSSRRQGRRTGGRGDNHRQGRLFG